MHNNAANSENLRSNGIASLRMTWYTILVTMTTASFEDERNPGCVEERGASRPVSHSS